MFGLFKRQEWKPEVVSVLKGSCNGLRVVLRNCPCLRDEAGEKRTNAYPDFGTDFLADLTDRQLGDFAHLQKLVSY